MDWIEELNKFGYNVLVDELVWHLEQGRTPLAVVKCSSKERIGYEFRFEGEKPHFLEVFPELLDKHWIEAQEVTKGFPEIRELAYVVN